MLKRNSSLIFKAWFSGVCWDMYNSFPLPLYSPSLLELQQIGLTLLHQKNPPFSEKSHLCTRCLLNAPFRSMACKEHSKSIYLINWISECLHKNTIFVANIRSYQSDSQDSWNMLRYVTYFKSEMLHKRAIISGIWCRLHWLISCSSCVPILCRTQNSQINFHLSKSQMNFILNLLRLYFILFIV